MASEYPQFTAPETARFWAKVDTSGDCWLWTASTNSWGYGKICIRGKTIGSHRYAYMQLVGPINDGLFVLHYCDTPSCVRPDHLFLGTAKDNMQDMKVKGRSTAGDRNPSRLSPQCLRRGDQHWSRLYPERVARGEQSGRSKLSEAQVLAIRARSAEPRDQLAAEFHVGRNAIGEILSRRTWAHV